MLFLLFSIVLLASCSGQNTQVLDGEYYWINEYRNERAFTISGNKGAIIVMKLIILLSIPKIKQLN